MADYTLIGDSAAQDTVVIIAPAYVLPTSYPAIVQCESELLEVTGGAGDVHLSVNRGFGGTAAADHASGSTLSDVTPTYA